MLRRVIAPIFVLMTIFASCDLDKQEEAMKFSNEIAATNDTLAIHSSKWAEELKIAINTLDFSQLSKYRTSLVNYIDRKITEVEQMENVGGSEDMQQAELEFLKFEKNVVNSYFSAFEQMDSTTSLETIENAYMLVMQQGEQEQKMQQNMQQLREEYADKNDFPKPIE